MATGKRYYWIKLRNTFMTSDAVDYLMSQKDGANYVVLYQMLCLMTINTDGHLSREIGEIIIPYDIEKIQRDTKFFSLDTIRVALGLYRSLGLIYQDANGTLVLTDHASMVGSETDYAAQKRLQRVQKESLPELEDSGVDIVHTEIRDKRLDIRDKDLRAIEKDSKKQLSVNNPPLSPLGGHTPELHRAVESWLKYKKEKHQSYKPQGLEAILKKIAVYADRYGDDAVIEIIEDSMANNYMGIMFDRIKPPEKHGNGKTAQMLQDSRRLMDGWAAESEEP